MNKIYYKISFALLLCIITFSIFSENKDEQVVNRNISFTKNIKFENSLVDNYTISFYKNLRSLHKITLYSYNEINSCTTIYGTPILCSEFKVLKEYSERYNGIIPSDKIELISFYSYKNNGTIVSNSYVFLKEMSICMTMNGRSIDCTLFNKIKSYRKKV